MSALLLAAALSVVDADGPPPSAPLTRSSLEAIYQRAEFSRARDRDTGALAALWRRLGATLRRWFESSTAASYSKATRVVVLAGAVTMSLALLLVTARRLRRARVAGVGPPSTPPRRGAGGGATVDLERAYGRLEADPRSAMREGLLVLLAWLEERGLARGGHTETNREIARHLSRRGAPPERALALGRLLDGYDRSFYSLEPVDGARARRFLDELARLDAPAEAPRP